MAKSHLGATDLLCKTIQSTATQSRAKTAVGLAVWNLAGDNAVGVFLENMVLNIQSIQIRR